MVLLQNRLNFQLALASLPTLQLFVAPPSEVLGLVQSILEEFYTDGIDQVVSAQLDDKGDIVGEFVDRVGARQIKRYTYRIQDSEVAFKLLNPSEVQNFGLESFKPLFGKGSKAGQKKSCRKGTPCGGTCISASKMCRKAPGSASKAKIQEAKKKLGGAIDPLNAVKQNLPALEGSDKQIAWAESIRDEFVTSVKVRAEYIDSKIESLTAKGKTDVANNRKTDLEQEIKDARIALEVNDSSFWIRFKNSFPKADSAGKFDTAGQLRLSALVYKWTKGFPAGIPSDDKLFLTLKKLSAKI